MNDNTQNKRYDIFFKGKAKLVFTRMEVEDDSEGTAVCYNHIWESISEQKVELMDCFSSSPKNTHGSNDVDSIISVSRSVCLYCLYSIVTCGQL